MAVLAGTLLVVLIASATYGIDSKKKEFTVRSKRQLCNCVAAPSAQFLCSCTNPLLGGSYLQQQELQRQLQLLQGVSQCNCSPSYLNPLVQPTPQYNCQCFPQQTSLVASTPFPLIFPSGIFSTPIPVVPPIPTMPFLPLPLPPSGPPPMPEPPIIPPEPPVLPPEPPVLPPEPPVLPSEPPVLPPEPPVIPSVPEIVPPIPEVVPPPSEVIPPVPEVVPPVPEIVPVPTPPVVVPVPKPIPSLPAPIYPAYPGYRRGCACIVIKISGIPQYDCDCLPSSAYYPGYYSSHIPGLLPAAGTESILPDAVVPPLIPPLINSARRPGSETTLATTQTTRTTTEQNGLTTPIPLHDSGIANSKNITDSSIATISDYSIHPSAQLDNIRGQTIAKHVSPEAKNRIAQSVTPSTTAATTPAPYPVHSVLTDTPNQEYTSSAGSTEALSSVPPPKTPQITLATVLPTSRIEQTSTPTKATTVSNTMFWSRNLPYNVTEKSRITPPMSVTNQQIHNTGCEATRSQPLSSVSTTRPTVMAIQASDTNTSLSNSSTAPNSTNTICYCVNEQQLFYVPCTCICKCAALYKGISDNICLCSKEKKTAVANGQAQVSTIPPSIIPSFVDAPQAPFVPCLYFVVETCVCPPNYIQCGENLCCLQNEKFSSHKVTRDEPQPKQFINDRDVNEPLKGISREPTTLELFMHVLNRIKANLQKAANDLERREYS